MPSIIGKCKLFRIKHITLLEGDTFLRNKHDIAFFEIKCTFFGRKENTICISVHLYAKYAILVIILHCYHAFFILVHAKPPPSLKKFLIRNKTRNFVFLCRYKVCFN